MTKTSIYKCLCCKESFTARTADRARGWAKYCSKSCKAKKQTNNQLSALKKSRPWQRYERCHSISDIIDLRNNPRIIEPLYDECGERSGEIFFANFSNEEGSDI